MQMRTSRKSDLEVSAVGLGCFDTAQSMVCFANPQ